MDDLRQWLNKAGELGELKKIEGADWDLEIGTIGALNVKKSRPSALLHDNIKDYLPGYRLLNCAMSTQQRVALTLNLPLSHSDMELLVLLREKLKEWTANSDKFPPQKVTTGTVLENVHSCDDINVL